jgi:hypothetical protein
MLCLLPGQSKPLEGSAKKPTKRHVKVVTWVETHPSNANEMLTASAGRSEPLVSSPQNACSVSETEQFPSLCAGPQMGRSKSGSGSVTSRPGRLRVAHQITCSSPRQSCAGRRSLVRASAGSRARTRRGRVDTSGIGRSPRHRTDNGRRHQGWALSRPWYQMDVCSQYELLL